MKNENVNKLIVELTAKHTGLRGIPFENGKHQINDWFKKKCIILWYEFQQDIWRCFFGIFFKKKKQ